MHNTKLEAFMRFMNAMNMSHNTVATYMNQVESYLVLKHELGLPHKESAIQFVAMSSSPSTKRVRVAALNRYFQAIGQKVDMPRVQGRSERVISPLNTKAVNKLIEYVRGVESHGTSPELALLLMCDSGLRVSETIALRAPNVFLDKRRIVVVGKRNRKRAVPFSSRLAAALKTAMAHRGNDEPLTGYASRSSVSSMIRRACLASGVEPTTPHMLRHYFATRLLEGGANIADISALLGHTSIQTTERYFQLNTEHQQNVYDAIFQ